MWTWTFWKDALERAIKTAVQVFVVTYSAEAAQVTDMFSGDSLLGTLSLAAATAILSIGTSILSTGIGDGESASLVGTKPRG